VISDLANWPLLQLTIIFNTGRFRRDLPSFPSFAAALFPLLVTPCLAGVAFAQELEAPPPADATPPAPGTDGAESGTRQDAPDPSVAAPRILVAPAPSFPEAALAEGLTEAAVTVRVTIGVDGRVQEATVLESAGHGFDERAQATALSYLFEPATRDGEPVAARVLIRIEFRIPEPTAAAAVVPVPPPAPPAVEPSPPAETTGSITDTHTSPAEPVEVTVRGYSEADRLRRSAEAVHVVSTETAKRQTQDLGEVLARTQGVGVQRSAGLGSDTRISLNGLTDDQIRFFLDGVPLDFMGYPFGIANVPVNLVERIEIYRGVVPVRFGADALGGAINLVSDRDIEAGGHAAASFQAGSFGTYRATLDGHHLGEQSGWLTRVGAFLDLAENDYPMDHVVPDASGQQVPARVYRFHDGYGALGANLETGVLNKPWAKRLLLRGFVTEYDKEIPHNLMMTFNPYGDVELGEFTAGGTLRYEQAFFQQLAVSAVAGYAYRTISYSDVGECVYDWFGQCIDERAQPGERVGRAQEQDYWEHDIYARVNVDWLAHPDHALHLSLSPTYIERTGQEHRLPNPEARDPLSAERRLAGLVTGVEYELQLFERRLENRLFFKDYLQVLRSEDPLSNGVDFRREDRTTHRVGLGDGLRYGFLEWLYAKASYEWATRLPRPDEIFGDAFPVQPNLELKPEVSHNANLGVTIDALETAIGQVRADVNGFARDADELIRLVGDDQAASYQNVYSARSLGIESALGWTDPHDFVAIDGNATYVDFRNTSDAGGLADYEGDRIPNRPYLFATGNVRLRAHNVSASEDELSLTWTSRYVHSFYRSWESLGAADDKLEVPDQLLHSLSLSYFVRGDQAELSFSGEVHNLTDAKTYDFFGVPKPGRSTYFKVTASL